MNINWYPGHMTKARRQLQDKLKLIDLVIEVIDARAPKSTVNPDFEQLFSNKSRLYVLNKADLADEKITRQWVSYYRARGIFTFSYSAVKSSPQTLKKMILDAAAPVYERYAAKGMKKTVRALVAGVPNVGKSAILNRLLGTKRLKEENRPGVTRGMQMVKITPYLELMDSPGMLWPKIDNEETGAIIALLGSIRQEILDEEELAFYLLKRLSLSAPEQLMARYKLEELPTDPWEIMSQICKKRGFILKKGEYDFERGVKTLLEEFKNGKIGNISLEAPGDIDAV